MIKTSLFESLLGKLYRGVKIAVVSSGVVKILSQPERIIEFSLGFREDDGSLLVIPAYRAQFRKR